MDKTYDLVIVGGGPAGTGAGVYAARKKLKTALITKDWGGQSTVSQDIQNWIGTISISGDTFAKNLKEHVKAYADDVLDIIEGQKVTGIEKNNDRTFTVKTEKEEYKTKTVLIASGSHRRKLEVPGAEEFENKGITYCATCDAPMFSDQNVVVIGGGNAGFESASQLLAYAKSVTLIHRSENYRADPITVEKVLENPKMSAIKNADTIEIKGDKMVKSIVYKDKNTGEIKEIETAGIFVEIGLIPTTSYVSGLVELDEYNRIKTDPRNQRTLTEGVWAAGDCTDVLYHQNNIACGDAVKALEDIYIYIQRM